MLGGRYKVQTPKNLVQSLNRDKSISQEHNPKGSQQRRWYPLSLEIKSMEYLKKINPT